MGQTQNIEQQIQLLSNLQLGFGIAALLFLALAIFLFFYLHIPQVFNEYRGKSAQKAMEEMAANSSDSGRIVSMDKKSKNKKKGTGQLVQRRHYTDNLTDDLSGRMSQEFGEPTGQMNLNMANSSEANGMMQEPAANGSEATDVLEPSMMTGSEATDVLDPSMMAGSEATDVLDPSMMTGSEATDVLDPSMMTGSEATGALAPSMREDAQATDILTEAMLQEGGMAATDILDPSMIANPVQERQHVSTPEQEGTMVLDPNMLQHSNSTFEIERSIILIHTEKVI
ncbi:MAG: hypothetical protein SPL91_02785 [Oliverpabstia intestinalis]|uniref:hypothetical protein n=1 Tax=Oliverpabstia sp. TaxID=2815798 RepID=UPI00258AA57F|nr:MULTISPECIES: hypothetical protein [Oliverpabstia]MCI7525974.1 hypothetical protein [Oliverpabstia sp.]MDY5790420.1 hypothetical protein [Oliverpabstia intestinalis]